MEFCVEQQLGVAKAGDGRKISVLLNHMLTLKELLCLLAMEGLNTLITHSRHELHILGLSAGSGGDVGKVQGGLFMLRECQNLAPGSLPRKLHLLSGNGTGSTFRGCQNSEATI